MRAPALLFLFVLACDRPRVGNPCILEGDPDTSATVLASPALECEARQCLRVRGSDEALCTAECQADDDCEAMPESPCAAGFVCAVPFVTGDSACRKLCLCSTDAPRLPASQDVCPK